MAEHDVQTIAWPGPGTVVIEGLSGDVEIRGWDRPEVSAQAEADERAKLELKGNDLYVRPGGFLGMLGDLRLRVPHRADIRVQVASGEVKLEDLSGTVTLNAASGDVQARHLTGELELHTASGDASFRNCRFRRLEIETASGDLAIETPLEATGRYHISRASGDLKLLLPAEQRCTIRHKAMSGDIHCDLHHVLNRTRHTTEVLVNGGGVEMRVDSLAGDIYIRASGQAAYVAEEAPSPWSGADEKRGELEPFDVAEPSAPPSDAEARRLEILKAIEEKRMSVAEAMAALAELEQ